MGAIISAIKLAQRDQQALFISDTVELNKIVDKSSAAIGCVHYYLGGGIKSHDFIMGYVKVQRDTTIRKLKEEEIEDKLSGHVISDNYGFWYTADDTYESICARFIKQGNY